MPEFHQSHAVVVGIDDYQHGIPQLRTAVNDARRLAAMLEREHGYNVHLLVEDVTKGRLEALFGALNGEVGADDRLLVYFAGHGIALDGDDGPAGYLVPQDARPEDRGTFLPMTDLHAWLNDLRARHLLAIFDCCFAGAFRWASTRALRPVPEVIHKERYDRFIRDAAWQVITSAAYDQRALDQLAGDAKRGIAQDEGQNHSPFGRALFQALAGAGDVVPAGEGDGVITATELYLYLRDEVEIEAEEQASHAQTPGLWPLNKHDKGEYIFLVPGHELNLPPAPELTYDKNPYRGLKSYDEEHCQLFFGREEEIEDLAGLVTEQPFTAVLGASGTGKSSLVKAGLLPHLRGCAGDDERDAGAEAEDPWCILSPLRPTATPLRALGQVFVAELPEYTATASPSKLRSDEGALSRLIAAWGADNRGRQLLLVVDQLEELITLCRDEQEREQFLALLARAVEQLPDVFRLVVTLRTDFEPQLAEVTPLAGHWARDGARYVVPPMDHDDLRAVIEGPASVRVLYLEPYELVDALITDVIQTPGALPLLSFTLSELYIKYLERQEEGGRRGETVDRSLTEADYRDLGGVVGSLRNRATEEYEALPDDAHRETMRRVMLRMVAVEGGELARRRVPRSELEYPDEAENERVETVVERLVEARLLVEDREEGGEPYVEPAHDALVRAWDKLLAWKGEAEEYLPLQRRLAQAATEWDRAEDKDRTGLLWDGDPRLPQVEDVLWPAQNGRTRPAERLKWAKHVLWPSVGKAKQETWLNRRETEFVKQSVKRRSSIFRRIIRITLAIVIALLGLVVFAFYQRGQAERQAGVALSRLLANESQTAGEPELRILLALEAVRALTDKGYSPSSESTVQLQRAVREGPTKAWRFDEDHSPDIHGVEFSPDGGLFTLQRRDGGGMAQLIDITSQQAVALPLEMGIVDYYRFDPSGRYLAAVGENKALILDAKTRQQLCPPFQLDYNESVVLFDPTGSMLFTAPTDTFASRGLARPGDRPGQLWDTASCDTLSSVPIEGNLEGARFSQDGTRLLLFSDVVAEQVQESAGEANGTGTLVSHQETFTIWDVTSPREPVQITLSQANLRQSAVSQDGSRVALSGGDTVWVLDTVTAATIFTRTFDTGRSVYAFLSAEGQFMATTTRSAGESVQVWDLETGSEVSSFSPTLGGRLIGVGFLQADTGPALLLLGRQQLELRDVASGEVLLSPPPYENATIKMIERSPDDRELLISLNDGIVRLWSIGGRQEIARYPEPVSNRGSMAFSPDGRWIVMVTRGGTARLWPNRAAELRAVQDPRRSNSLLAANDSLLALTQSRSSSKRVVDLQGNVVLDGLNDACSEPVAFSPDGRWLATQPYTDTNGSCEKTGTQIWDLATMPAREHGWLPDDICGSLMPSLGCFVTLLSPTGNWFAFAETEFDTGSFDASSESATMPNRVTVWNIPRTERLPVLEHEFEIKAMAFSPTDDLLATLDSEGTVRLWRLESGTDPSPIVLPQNQSGFGIEEDRLAFSRDGRKFALASKMVGSIQAWDVESGELESDPYLPGEDTTLPGVKDFRFSHDGTTLVVLFGTDEVQLWDAGTLEPLSSSFKGHTGTVQAMALGTDGPRHLLVTGSDDGDARVWDLETGKELARLPHQTGVMSVAFTADGKQVVTVTDGNVIHVWPVQTETLMQMACNVVSRSLTEEEWADYIGEAKARRSTCEELSPVN